MKRPKPKRKKGKAGRPGERLVITDPQAALDKLHRSVSGSR